MVSGFDIPYISPSSSPSTFHVGWVGMLAPPCTNRYLIPHCLVPLKVAIPWCTSLRGALGQPRQSGCLHSTWSLSHKYILTKQIDQGTERRSGPQKIQKSGDLEGGVAYRGWEEEGVRGGVRERKNRAR